MCAQIQMNMHVWYTNLRYDIIDVVISSLNIWIPFNPDIRLI